MDTSFHINFVISVVCQGAASSVLLFIAFIDDLIYYLKEHCPAEPILSSLRCVLHADDTVIISTSREPFIQKCNLMPDYFDKNSLSLNRLKSGYTIINGKNDICKGGILLKNGTLEYKTVVTYLGVKISNRGIVKHVVDLYIDEKRSNISIKYSRFCGRNFPVRVLNTCVSASLTYGCDTWGRSQLNCVEKCSFDKT